ncbi:MAG TPA: hypothetical protein VFA32_14140 [Dehalococcoidia bacterium]|nr:hypothetical protein [Dehalococcoidia bacterium]
MKGTEDADEETGEETAGGLLGRLSAVGSLGKVFRRGGDDDDEGEDDGGGDAQGDEDGNEDRESAGTKMTRSFPLLQLLPRNLNFKLLKDRRPLGRNQKPRLMQHRPKLRPLTVPQPRMAS